MFDAHIQYYAYNNVEDDDFGVGYVGNKEDWIDRINRWNRNEGISTVRTVEDWDDLDCRFDLRGCQLAEVEPDELGGYTVTWESGEKLRTITLDKNYSVVADSNAKNVASVPRWISRLKTMLKAQS